MQLSQAPYVNPTSDPHQQASEESGEGEYREKQMEKLFIFCCFVIMLFATAGYPSNEPATGVGNSKVSSSVVSVSKGSLSKDNAAAIPEAFIILMIGYGLVGLAALWRKMTKKYKEMGRIFSNNDDRQTRRFTNDLSIPGVSPIRPTDADPKIR